MIAAVDIESCSAADIRHGAWAYAQHESTRVWCVVFGFADDDGDYEFVTWKPGEPVPDRAVRHLAAGLPLFAHNMQFEHAVFEHILVHHGWPVPRDHVWRDTMQRAAAANLPASLAGAAAVIAGAEQKGDSSAMRAMAKVKRGPDGWIYPPADRLAELIEYCRQDVATTLDLARRLPEPSLTETLVISLDRKVNLRGVWIDLQRAERIARMADLRQQRLADAAFERSRYELSGTSAVQALKTWANERGAGTDTLDRQTVLKLLDRDDLDPDVRALLELRVEAGKATSLGKLKRLKHMVGADGRLRWALRYHGAHTGRWSSHGLQVHNMPKDKLGAAASGVVDLAIEEHGLDLLELLFESPLSALSQSLRSVIAAAPGHELLGGDWSAIEARVLAWLAGQDDVLAVFEAGRDLYTEVARKIDSTDRQLGKVAQLGLGYGMGVLKFVATAASFGLDLSLKEARRVQKAWREANPAVTQFWFDLERAARDSLTRPGVVFQVGEHIRLRTDNACMRVRLPSGRMINYWRPHTKIVEKTFETVDEEGRVRSETREMEELRFFRPDGGRMVIDSAYGGKLTENVTQAVARDVLADALIRVEHLPPYRCVLHVHDSLVAEVPKGEGDLDEFRGLLETRPHWGRSLPLKADVYRSKRFKG